MVGESGGLDRGEDAAVSSKDDGVVDKSANLSNCSPKPTLSSSAVTAILMSPAFSEFRSAS